MAAVEKLPLRSLMAEDDAKLPFLSVIGDEGGKLPLRSVMGDVRGVSSIRSRIGESGISAKPVMQSMTSTRFASDLVGDGVARNWSSVDCGF